MFADQNSVLRRTSSSARPGVGLWSMNGVAEAQAAARDGWLAAGWFTFGYIFGGAMIASRLVGLAQENPTAITVIALIYGFFALLGVLLAGFLFFRQPRWAAVVLTGWAGLELLFKLITILYAGFFVLPGLVVNLAAFLIALRSARGAFALATFRKARLTPAMVDETFR